MVLGHNISDGLRTQDVQVSEDVTFDTMLLAGNTLKGLTDSGFYKPSPIQLHAIPLGKCGFDLLLEAKSGTGKTAVFTVIALEKLDVNKDLQTLILAPTREIAAQICDVIRQIGASYLGLNIEVVMGGLPIIDDIEKLKNKVHVIVGSPGRLRHLIQGKHIDTSSVRLLVLDEADKLMDKSFQADINYIFSTLPVQKQVIMSSATYSETLTCLIKKYVRNAQHICPDSTSILLGIRQYTTTVQCNTNIVKQTQYRFSELLNILTKKQFKQSLVFCNYQVRVKELSKMLTREKWPVEQLHGQQEQTDRLDALKTLQEYKCRILVSTDLAARGIDASNVDLVINFEPPYEWQTYLHRIGRAGRFGSYGEAITILAEGQEQGKFKKLIQSINGSLEIRNLWDNEKYDHIDSEVSNNVSSSTSVSQDIIDNEVANILVKTEDEKTNGEIQSFVNLFSSFEESIKGEIKIEAFTDLIASFESHTFNNNTDMKTFEYKECDIPKLNGDNINSNKEDVEEPSSIEINQSQSNYSRRNNNKNREYFETNNIEGDMSNALLDAGLPTCFSSRSQNRQTKSNKHHYHKRSTNSQVAQDRDRDQIQNHSEEIVNETVIEEPSSNTVNCDHNLNYHAQSFSRAWKNKDMNSYEENDSNAIKYSRKKKATTTKCDTDSNSNFNSRYEEYSMWYNKLKCHVNQIQMALYIEELSNKQYN